MLPELRRFLHERQNSVLCRHPPRHTGKMGGRECEEEDSPLADRKARGVAHGVLPLFWDTSSPKPEPGGEERTARGVPGARAPPAPCEAAVPEVLGLLSVSAARFFLST